VTEAGGAEMGLVKSAAGIGALLCDGIGDTFRVSLTADPVAEIAAARKILNALEIEGQCGLQIVSCPTCGRTKIDLIDLHTRFEAAVRAEGLEDLPVKVALMGCIVNGPGEAREADIGIAGGKGEALLFAKGEILGKISEEAVIPTLIGKLKEMKR
jgi:(E)-4-hydroxy-3-methylbut-2-enyl-diphosphate synthase